MKVASIGVLRATLLWLLLPQPSWSADLPGLIEQVRPSVVGVGTAFPPRQPNVKGNRVAYLGTGFVVGNGRQVVTNAHIIAVDLDVENNQFLAVFTGRGATATVHAARVARRDEVHDLVLLDIGISKLPALQLGNSGAVREGQEIAFTGFPIGMALGLYPVTHRGIISAIAPTAQPSIDARELNSLKVSRTRSGFDAFQLDATAYPGNSGSPVFELENGRVVGVINSVLVKETRETLLSNPSGITYAVPAKFIEPLLDPQR
ncbi:MAG TPA: serine protease [Halioglobus sp.]